MIIIIIIILNQYQIRKVQTIKSNRRSYKNKSTLVLKISTLGAEYNIYLEDLSS